MILERGALLNNRYRIVEILGQGGMGSVYRAVDENLGVEVAVKDNLFTTDEYARQFRREAVILANLRHPNLPRVTDHFVIEEQGQYLVMDYIDGEDLRQRMDRVGVLNDTEAILIGSAICDALSFLSTRNPPIIHRDIKPGNVKITPQGQIFLVDFGLAKVLQGSEATTTGARAMTPGYSPPEQYGTARTDHRSDVFSLGATLYAALTGAIPEDALARAMEQVELTPIRKHNPRVAKRLASVIEKSLAVRPDDRFQDAEEFKQALRSAMTLSRRRTGEILISPPPELEDRPIPAERAHPATPPAELVVSKLDRTPLPISTPLDDERKEPPARPHQRSGRLGGWLVIAIVALLAVGGGLAAYVYDPDLPSLISQARAWILPAALIPQSPTPAGAILPLTPLPTETQGTTSTASVQFAVDPGQPSPTPSLTPSPTVTIVPTATDTPLPTPFGGGGGQIAFASDRTTGVFQVYVMNTDGTRLHQVTNMSEGACQPDWSPDGQRIVFISPCAGNYDRYPQSAMFVINVDGSQLSPLPYALKGDYDPAWSPDGTRIAFTSLRDGRRPRIYVYHFEDDSVVSLSDPDNPYWYDSQPAWSPDGNQIAFITTRRGPAQVWLMDADGQNQELFSHSKNRINDHPTWSPDGELILFTQYDSVGSIPRLVAAQLGDVELVETDLYQAGFPMREGRYSPDGSWIALEGWPQGGNHDIFIMASNGAGLQPLTTDPRTDFDVAWKPVP